MSDPQHEQYEGLAALYAMGALNARERTVFESHLEICRTCVDEVTALLPVSHGLAHTAPPVEPPEALRVRVLQSVTGETESPLVPDRETMDDMLTAVEEPEAPTVHVEEPARSGAGTLFWLAATLLLAAAGAIGWYVAELDRRVTDLRATVDAANALTVRANTSLAQARTQANERNVVLNILAGADVERLELDGQPIAPRARARVLWDSDRRMVFLASDVPALAAGDVYQLWFVLPDGPASAALVEPDAAGSVTTLVEVPDTIPLPVTMAVTVEPDGGMPAPTGDIYLLGQVN